MIALDECMDIDDPIAQENFTELLRKVMQEGSSTWDAIWFMDQIKDRHIGFDYPLKFDSFGRPEAIMWMFPHQRCNLLKYGHTVFLDGQKKQFNDFGWPYIGPAVKDSEFKVQTCAESICIEESNNVYTWIMKSMFEIESRFKISDIRLIYANQLISNTVLVDLGIQEMCTLHCDYYHLLEEDWPKYFGAHTHNKIKPYLEKMLTSCTEDEHQNAYFSAIPHVQGNAEHAMYLQKIFSKPAYYWLLFAENRRSHGIEGVCSSRT
jgi:hypothetical protein